MNIETTEEVLDEIANRFMIYGACKSENPQECDNGDHFCCRVGFTAHYQDRLDNAHADEVKLKRAGLK